MSFIPTVLFEINLKLGLIVLSTLAVKKKNEKELWDIKGEYIYIYSFIFSCCHVPFDAGRDADSIPIGNATLGL